MLDRHVEDGVTQIRPYLHFLSQWRSFRDSIPPRQGNVRAEASPLLIYAVVVLAFLLTVLEVDAHRGELEWLGLLPIDYPILAALLSP
jgi:hypothetical protein